MTGLSLRSRLSLAFALLALIPLVSVIPFAVRNLRRTLTEELSARADASTVAARVEVERRCFDAQRSVEQLIDSSALEDVARRARSGTPPAQAAAIAMKARGLGVLAVLNDEGKTLSSGHLPARFLDLDLPLRRLAEATRGHCQIEQIVVPRADGLTAVPAMVAGGLLEYGETRIWVLAGTRLDSGFVEPLSRVTGAQIELRQGGQPLATSGPAAAVALTREMVLAPQTTLELSMDASALREAEKGLTRAFLSMALLGLVLSAVLGLFVASRLTRPLEALTQGARDVSSGALDTRISVPASGEVAILLDAFNQMTENLKATTEGKLAAERVAAWQEIARSLAHELKNPLTPIQMSLETLVAAGKTNHPRFQALFQESAQGMLEEVERLRRTVDSFSRFARLPKPTLAPLDLSDLVRQVLAVHGSMPANIELKSELATGIQVNGDRDQLIQVMVNLVGNAREALAETGGRIEVRASLDQAEGVVEVADTGPGIPVERRARLFEPYFTTKAGGTGLGLAIASRIAHEHGGRLELDASPPPGAKFRLRLPRR